ncbi:MAG TPA: phosphoribosylformylglycinamidine synthase subunit PurS [Syntrophomonadaceae bacterium]|nr:phosphoribosylformylglycinamidine synthase subunit PurS [Syntrophomonadaceae bacterium]
MFKGHVYITLKEGVLDPQGKAAENSLDTLGFSQINQVKFGKFIEVELEAENKEEAVKQLKAISEKLLANLVIENYRVEVVEVDK